MRCAPLTDDGNGRIVRLACNQLRFDFVNTASIEINCRL